MKLTKESLLDLARGVFGLAAATVCDFGGSHLRIVFMDNTYLSFNALSTFKANVLRDFTITSDNYSGIGDDVTSRLEIEISKE